MKRYFKFELRKSTPEIDALLRDAADVTFRKVFEKGQVKQIRFGSQKGREVEAPTDLWTLEVCEAHKHAVNLDNWFRDFWGKHKRLVRILLDESEGKATFVLSVRGRTPRRIRLSKALLHTFASIGIDVEISILP